MLCHWNSAVSTVTSLQASSQWKMRLYVNWFLQEVQYGSTTRPGVTTSSQVDEAWSLEQHVQRLHWNIFNSMPPHHFATSHVLMMSSLKIWEFSCITASQTFHQNAQRVKDNIISATSNTPDVAKLLHWHGIPFKLQGLEPIKFNLWPVPFIVSSLVRITL